MKTFKFIKFCLIVLVSIPIISLKCYSLNVPDELKNALKTGNTKEISKFFDTNVELEILGDENIYNKAQADQVVKIFFDEHPVVNFTVLFEGGKDASQYAIGKLITSKGTFRVNLLVKNQILLQLRIEEDNGK
jgi:hypothetical protein